MEKQTAYIIPHTHWDREWRYPLWENRQNLVDMMEELLDMLDRDPEYRFFLFDGQTVSLDDYLEVRPAERERLTRHVSSGRLSAEPWYTLPDLYPLDGESLVRNLLKGTRRALALGGCMRIGYESFGWGQTAQFPQIYTGFGIDTVFVAKNIDRSRAPECEFLWEGADGTRVLASRFGQFGRANFFMNTYLDVMNGMEYLSPEYRFHFSQQGRSYHQADTAGHIQDHIIFEHTARLQQERLPAALEKAWKAMDDTLLPDDRVLMNGSDSTTAQPELPSILAAANAISPDRRYVHATLEEYVSVMKAKLPVDRLRVVKGELRDGPTTSLSGNALMTRPYIKHANKQAQTALFRKAEPFATLVAALGGRYEREFLDKAMDSMLLAHPHDSINGVTQDKTADDVLHSISQTQEIAGTVFHEACRRILTLVDQSRHAQDDILLVAFNPLPTPRRDVVTAYVDIPRERELWDFALEDSTGTIRPLQAISRIETIIPVSDLHARPWPFFADRHCVVFDTGVIPACGYRTYRVVPGITFDRTAVFWPETRKTLGRDIATSVTCLENAFLQVTVESDGTLSIRDKTTGRVHTGLNHYEDTGDCGDYWMYYPPYHNRTYSSRGLPFSVSLEENGPLSATIVVATTMTVPARAYRPEAGIRGESRRSDESAEIRYEARFNLRDGERFLRVHLAVDNQARDHRCRVMFDTGIYTTEVVASGHFTWDRRPLEPLRGGDGRYFDELATQPMQDFVDRSDGTSGFAVVATGFCEYEAKGNREGTVALTLLRAVRNLICTEMRSGGYFPDQEGGQCLRRLQYDYLLCPHDGGVETGGIQSLASLLAVPPVLVQTCRATLPLPMAPLPEDISLFSLSPASLQFSCLKAAEDRDAFILRVFNPTDIALDGCARFHVPLKAACLLDLDENPKGSMAMPEPVPLSLAEEGHALPLHVEPQRILTVELQFCSRQGDAG
jgi:mannosylglycerate hydrolase